MTKWWPHHPCEEASRWPLRWPRLLLHRLTHHRAADRGRWRVLVFTSPLPQGIFVLFHFFIYILFFKKVSFQRRGDLLQLVPAGHSSIQQQLLSTCWCYTLLLISFLCEQNTNCGLERATDSDSPEALIHFHELNQILKEVNRTRVEEPQTNGGGWEGGFVLHTPWWSLMVLHGWAALGTYAYTYTYIYQTGNVRRNRLPIVIQSRSLRTLCPI